MLRFNAPTLALAALLMTAGCDDDPQDGPLEPPVTVDPCADVPTRGHCLGNTVERCVVATGNGETTVARFACLDDERCVVDGQGARCVLDAECRGDDAVCDLDGRLRRCVDGRWFRESCQVRCVDSGANARCVTGTPTIAYSGTLTYELRGPNQAFTDWSPDVATVAAKGFLVLSVADGEVVDATVTDDEGRYTIQAVAPADADDDDGLAAVAARLDDDGALVYAVMDPGLGEGSHYPPLDAAPDAELWFWRWTARDIPGGDVTIPVTAGSGAARVFDYLRFAHDFARSFYGAVPDAGLVVWLGGGATWSCGECFAAFPVLLPWGERVPNQIFVPDDADAAWWSDAVTAHELGHWLMSTYGRSPGEGGAHVFGIPSHPGLAWSEGWATWFSSLVRDSAVYYDKQDGLFLWVDLAARTYGQGQPWLLPEARFGLEQLIDENEVARMLLSLTTESSIVGMLDALASPRMTRPPFARGYRRRSWDGLDDQGWPLPYTITDASAPHLADYLDTLICQGAVPAADVAAATDPTVRYPYPFTAPLCESGRLPVRVAFEPPKTLGGPGPHTLAARVTWDIALERPLTASLTIPSGAKLLAGTATLTIPPGPPGERRLTWTLLGPADLDGVGLSVATGGDDWGVSGVVTPSPRPTPRVTREGPPLTWRGRTLGRGIRLRP